MGLIKHHAIIVTGIGSYFIHAYNKATSIFPNVSGILPSPSNGYASFFIPPDGGNENWEASNIGDKKRNDFIAYLSETKTDLQWIEVSYSVEEGLTKITRADNIYNA